MDSVKGVPSDRRKRLLALQVALHSHCRESFRLSICRLPVLTLSHSVACDTLETGHDAAWHPKMFWSRLSLWRQMACTPKGK